MIVLAPWLAVPSLAGVEADVARGWYLWRTGQDEAAAAVAAAAVAAAPSDLSAIDLHVAMQVAQGNGFSVESAYREWWGERPSDPARRVALAMAVTWRNQGDGSWCAEVVDLIEPVVDGEPHYWATVTDRQRELRCTGQTGHADAELRRLAKSAEGRGFADGVLAKMDAGYIKPELPDELEKVWASEPFRLDRAASLWREGVGGPGKAAARRVAKQALDAALEGSDPVAVHAALVAYTGSGQDKEATEAAARLVSLDPKADPKRIRKLEEVVDPPLYGQIDLCTQGYDQADSLECIDGLPIPETGSVAAYAHYVRKLLFEAIQQPDQAYAAARSAWLADKAHRFDARHFARLAQARGEDLPLALEAIDVALAGRLPETGAEVAPELRAGLARDLELRVEILRALGRYAEAVPLAQQVQALEPSPARQLLVGLVMAEAGDRPDEAALVLSYALVTPIDDTKRVTAARDALAKVAWLKSTQAMVDAAARDPKEEGPPHALVGAKLTDAALLPTPAPDAKKPGVRVVATFASWRPESVEALERLGSLAQRYAAQGVTVVALGVDAAAPTALPVVAGVEVRHAGPGAMRALKSVALPTVVVVDPKGAVVAALSPYDRSSLALESAIDPLVPKP